MTIMISKKVRAILPYLIAIIILFYILKPIISFKPNGQLREYGFGYDLNGYKKTLYTMHILIIFIIIILYVYL